MINTVIFLYNELTDTTFFVDASVPQLCEEQPPEEAHFGSSICAVRALADSLWFLYLCCHSSATLVPLFALYFGSSICVVGALADYPMYSKA
jgi:hypothetical protein